MEDLEELKHYLFGFIYSFQMKEEDQEALYDTAQQFINEFYYYI